MTGPPFWIAQAVWWAFYVVVSHLASLPQLADPSLAGQVYHLGLKLEKAAAGCAASLVLHAILRATATVRAPARVALVVVAAFGLGVGWEIATRAMYGWALIDDQVLRAALLPTFVLIAWTGLEIAFELRDRALRATALATEAQLAMLRYQVHPHFLFNALNSLRALIDDDPARARHMVTQLAELFRHSLRTTGDSELTVADEIAAIRNYLDIQKIRFDDDLEVAIEVDPVAATTRLPGFLIHPLVENAVKYGLDTSPPPLRVTIRAARERDRLTIEVANTGRWHDGPPDRERGTGTGLRNLRERLAHLYPGRHQLEVGEVDGWVRARLELEVAP